MTGTPLPPLPVARLLLWRHARTEWNATGRFQGQQDPPLDAEGRNEALRAAPALVASGLSAEDTVVVSSDLSRAAETAATLTGLLGIPLLEDPRLREHGLGCWEGLTRAEVADRYPDQYADWLAGRPVRGRGGEEPGHVAERALAALADLPPARVAVVVTHGGTAGRLVEGLLGLGPEHRRVLGPLASCAWSELVAQGPQWRLLRHNSSVLSLADGQAAAPRPGAAPSVSTAEAALPGERNPGEIGDADAVG